MTSKTAPYGLEINPDRRVAWSSHCNPGDIAGKKLRKTKLGMLADFFIADPDEALRYANRIEDPDEGEEIERLEIGTLWAILEGREWDVKMRMPKNIYLGEDGESWLHRFPVELTNLLANSDEDGLASASVQWAKTEELDCNPADSRPLLVDLQSLARQAPSDGKSIYLWGCL